MRGLLGEYGVILPQGAWRFLAQAQDAIAGAELSDLTRELFADTCNGGRSLAVTPAEIRLAKAIAGGRKLAEVARLLGVSTETARAHLKSVFAKSGAHSQSKLSVLLDRMAGPQDDR